MRPHLIGAALLLGAGCGDDSTLVDATTRGDADQPSVTLGEAPVVRDARIDLTGLVDQTFDIGAEDAVVVLPEVTPSLWIVQIRDDRTAAEELSVAVIDEEGSPVSDQEGTFERGNWRIRSAVAPGHTLTVRIEDGDGNVTTHPHTLRVPTLAEAAVGTWERRDFDAEQAITGRVRLSMLDDRTWERSSSASGSAAGPFETLETGRWQVDDTAMTFETLEAPSDGNPSPLRVTETAPFYVDTRYFTRAPWQRQEGSGAEGTFRRARRVDGTMVEESLTLGSGGSYSFVREAGGEETLSQAGTFAVELTENYEDSLGDFLVVTLAEENGAPVAEARATLEIFIELGPYLLLDPLIRVRESP